MLCKPTSLPYTVFNEPRSTAWFFVFQWFCFREKLFTYRGNAKTLRPQANNSRLHGIVGIVTKKHTLLERTTPTSMGDCELETCMQGLDPDTLRQGEN